MRLERAVIFLVVLASIAVLTIGCQKSAPAAQTEFVHEPGEPALNRTLTSHQQASVEGAFGSLADGRTAVSKPVPAAGGGERWSDMEAAVAYACDDIEAAVVSRTEHDWGWEFHLRTVEDWPGTLTIRRVTPTKGDSPTSARIYEATCTIGIYGDHKDRANALLTALDKQLLAFGKKPKLPE